jgi:type IV pilus assembly protein PilQ
MRLRHLVISSLAAAALGVPATAADAPTQVLPGGASQGAEANLTIETSDKPLEVVLQWVSRRAGVNIICNEADQPRVTLRMVNVTWQEAVAQIAIKYDLVIERKSDRVWNLVRPPKVRMEFQDARLGVVLEALARQANVNIVFSDIDADKKITMTLNGVPWKQALDVIVRDVGYAWVEREYSIIQVVTPDKLQKDLQTVIFQLNNVAADSLKEIAAQTLGADGKAVSDAHSNKLILTGTAPALEKTVVTLTSLDTRPRQVQIAMKFVEFSDSEAQKIGFDPITASFNLAQVGTMAAGFRPFNATPTAAAALASTAGSRPTSNGNFSGSVTFEAINTLQSTEILQEPTILTLDNRPATINIGREIRFAEETVTQENNSVVRSLAEASTSPVKDGVTITVTPQITADGFVIINLNAKNEEATLTTYSNKANPDDPDASAIQLPNKDMTNLDTVIQVQDGRTAVIGGILRNRNIEKRGSIPWLGDIPVLGWLFKKTETSVDRRNLTIFITPRILRTDNKSEQEQRLNRLREDLRGTAAKPAPVTGAANPVSEGAKPLE